MTQRVFHVVILMIVLVLGSAFGCSRSGGDAEQVSSTSSATDSSLRAPSTVQGFEARFVVVNDQGGVPVKTWHDGTTLHLDDEAIINSDDVVEVNEEVGSDGRESLILRLDDSSATRFAVITGQKIGRQLALVVGGKVVHSPTIREAITGGSIRVSKCSGLEISQMAELIKMGQLTEPP